MDMASTRGSYLPIGTPTEDFIWSMALELVPLGAVGELCVARDRCRSRLRQRSAAHRAGICV